MCDNLWHPASEQKNIRQYMKNMLKFCSHPEALKTNFIEYLWQNYQRLMCHSFLPVFNYTTSDVLRVLQKSYARQVKLSCQPYVYYICKHNAAARACSARNLSRHFWAAYGLSGRKPMGWWKGRINPWKSG